MPREKPSEPDDDDDRPSRTRQWALLVGGVVLVWVVFGAGVAYLVAKRRAADADVTYTIRLPEREPVGQKQLISREGERTATADGHSETRKSSERYYQTVDTDRARITRTYLWSRDGAEKRDRPYSRGTVVIERRGDLYEFTLNGRRLTAAESPHLAEEFADKKKSNPAEFLPRAAVRLNESWSVDAGALRDMFRGAPAILDPEKTSIQGRLDKVYTSAGGQYGVIEWKMSFAFRSTRKNEPSQADVNLTYEGPIDGSAGEEKVSTRFYTSWFNEEPGERVVKVEAVETEFMTRAPATD